MGSEGIILVLVQLFCTVLMVVCFWSLSKSHPNNRMTANRDCRRELEKLQRMRAVALTEPLTEKTRPASFGEIIGQEEGINALRAALCGPNPQHVIIYGPPGVGKTAAARLVLEEARGSPLSPFKEHARFVEFDATTSRFDERGIADPLIGSVHDPIYQGAGPLGQAGVPQPKPGAVTRAHGGILFIDEIGELHPVQLNKLLKVLEDRKVFLESAYYNPEDPNIPGHIHDIFQNGLPADFRLVGATTRAPEEISPAIRSRCLEIFFRSLTPQEIRTIAARAAQKIGFTLEDGVLELIGRYAANGREAVNMLQLASGLALVEGRRTIGVSDVHRVIQNGRYSTRPVRQIPSAPQVGVANGLGVHGPNLGVLLELEVVALPVAQGRGKVTMAGVVEEEEVSGRGRSFRRRSTVCTAVDIVLTALRHTTGIRPGDYNLHINFPGGVPVDGPSVGVALGVAVYSAITGVAVKNTCAMTGEVSLRGVIRPVGGLVAKMQAAREAGVELLLVPRDNFPEVPVAPDLRVVPVDHLSDALKEALIPYET